MYYCSRFPPRGQVFTIYDSVGCDFQGFSTQRFSALYVSPVIPSIPCALLFGSCLFRPGCLLLGSLRWYIDVSEDVLVVCGLGVRFPYFAEILRGCDSWLSVSLFSVLVADVAATWWVFPPWVIGLVSFHVPYSPHSVAFMWQIPGVSSSGDIWNCRRIQCVHLCIVRVAFCVYVPSAFWMEMRFLRFPHACFDDASGISIWVGCRFFLLPQWVFWYRFLVSCWPIFVVVHIFPHVLIIWGVAFLPSVWRRGIFRAMRCLGFIVISIWFLCLGCGVLCLLV